MVVVTWWQLSLKSALGPISIKVQYAQYITFLFKSKYFWLRNTFRIVCRANLFLVILDLCNSGEWVSGTSGCLDTGEFG